MTYIHNLITLLCECKMSFKIGSLTCVKYIEKQPISSPSAPPTFSGEQRSVPNFEKTECQKKNEYLGGLKAWGITVFLVKKN